MIINSDPTNHAVNASNDGDRLARILALYLPQFYPTPENNKWWGNGFTEWTNVSRARPLFDGHYQPHIPAHLGFYDTRVSEVREAQAELARRHSIEGFCYWHYWFHGKRLLERPYEEMLKSGKPDFPFCLSWANETWQRRWHGTGDEKETLQIQEYSAADDLKHVRYLLPAFADPRYIRIANRPVFCIYRPKDLPNPLRTVEIFRSECERNGLPAPFMIGLNAHVDLDFRSIGFDGTMNFEPQLGALPGPGESGLKIYDYPIARQRMAARKKAYPSYPCIFVSWDNTPRRGENGICFLNTSPSVFKQGLSKVIESTLSKPLDDRIVFVNAWNEWAEGNHLEPDLKYGLQWLEAVRDANTPVTSPALEVSST